MLSLILKHSLIFFVALIFAFNLFIVIILLYAFWGTAGTSVARSSLSEDTESNRRLLCSCRAPSGVKAPQNPAMCLRTASSGACWERLYGSTAHSLTCVLGARWPSLFSRRCPTWWRSDRNCLRIARAGPGPSRVLSPLLREQTQPVLVAEQYPRHKMGSWRDQDPHSLWLKYLLNEWVSKPQKRKTAPNIKNSVFKQPHPL